MQLKVRRSQREGALSSGIIFCLDARAEYTPEERTNIQRYKLGGQVIYHSQAAQAHIDRANQQHAQATNTGYIKALGSFAMARLHLHVTIASLERGHHIECKTLDELVAAESAIMDACENLKGYLDTAKSFDGTEGVFSFDTGMPVLVSSSTPQEPLFAPGTAAETTASVSGPSYSDGATAGGEGLDGFIAAQWATPGGKVIMIILGLILVIALYRAL